MPIGPFLRHRLGPLEQTAADIYRGAFFNVDHFTELTLTLAPRPSRILEIGCGDGDIATRLTTLHPEATYVGVDVDEGAGRRFRGEERRAEFRPILSSQLRAEDPKPFDLIVLVDVLHHVADTGDRTAIVEDAAAMLAPGGTVLVKEWEKVGGPAYHAGYLADRYITGDPTVRYMTRPELLDIIKQGAPALTHRHTLTIRPWRCNVVHALS